MEILKTIQKVPIFYDEDKAVITFLADADVDNDGSGGNIGNDPSHQSETSLKYEGESLNAQTEAFAVCPLELPLLFPGKVLGCQGEAYNHRNGKSVRLVVGDFGPASKIGELSVAACIALGINPDPVHGGEDEYVIGYTFWPGVPAVANGRTYELQAYGG